MTPKERQYAAIRREPIDRISFDGFLDRYLRFIVRLRSDFVIAAILKLRSKGPDPQKQTDKQQWLFNAS
jgi:hypothetical protein